MWITFYSYFIKRKQNTKKYQKQTKKKKKIKKENQNQLQRVNNKCM